MRVRCADLLISSRHQSRTQPHCLRVSREKWPQSNRNSAGYSTGRQWDGSRQLARPVTTLRARGRPTVLARSGARGSVRWMSSQHRSRISWWFRYGRSGDRRWRQVAVLPTAQPRPQVNERLATYARLGIPQVREIAGTQTPRQPWPWCDRCLAGPPGPLTTWCAIGLLGRSG